MQLDAPAKKRSERSNPKAASRPRMTSILAEERSVGDATKPKFNGVALLRLLKK
jgi:hypothetical protein